MKKVILTLLLLLSSSSLLAEISEKDFLEAYKAISIEQNASLKLEGAIDVLKKGNEYQKFLILKAAAEAAYELRNFDNATMYAEKMLSLSKQFQNDWNYGNAVHSGNIVLGRVALKKNNIEAAKEYLIKAGKTPGSPQLNTFGPSMSLANDLFENGEKETVIEYLKLCKKFWEMNDGRLDSWVAAIKGGGKPYFGVNLHF